MTPLRAAELAREAIARGDRILARRRRWRVGVRVAAIIVVVALGVASLRLVTSPRATVPSGDQSSEALTATRRAAPSQALQLDGQNPRQSQALAAKNLAAVTRRE